MPVLTQLTYYYTIKFLTADLTEDLGLGSYDNYDDQNIGQLSQQHVFVITNNSHSLQISIPEKMIMVMAVLARIKHKLTEIANVLSQCEISSYT